MSAAARIETARRERMGFLLPADVAAIAADPRTRLTPVLVRCGGCRFVAPAQDVTKLIAAVEASGDHVRDCSLPA